MYKTNKQTKDEERRKYQKQKLLHAFLCYRVFFMNFGRVSCLPIENSLMIDEG